MLGWMAHALRVRELRRRLLFTALVLAVYRFGSLVPAPGVDPTAISNFLHTNGSTIFGLLNLLSGSSLARLSLFALGIVPYVTASIVVQLLTKAIPRLTQLQREGEAGYAQLNQYTRYPTRALGAAQATGYGYVFIHAGALHLDTGRFILLVLTLTAGTALLMWLREQNNKRGLGDGISLLLFASLPPPAPAGSPPP